MLVVNQVFRISHVAVKSEIREILYSSDYIRTGGNMFVVGNFVTGIAYVFDMLLNIYFWIILIRTVLSWIQPNPYNPLVRTIYKLVDPVTYKISRMIPTRLGMIDFAPFILMIIIVFLQRFLVRSLFEFGARMN